MRILIATGIYPPSIGGPATYAKLLNEELPKRGIETEVVSFDEVRHMPKIIRHLNYFVKVFCGAKNADMIYAQDPVSVGFPSYWAAKFTNKKFFLKVVGDYAWEQGMQRFGVMDSLDDFSGKSKRAYSLSVQMLCSVERFVAKRADRVIVPSIYLKKIVSRWGVDEKKIVVINNAFDGIKENESGDRVKIQLLGRTIVSSGRLVPWKGFMALVETMVDLLKKFPDLKLFIIGDGPERGSIERRIKQLELGRNVYLVGKVPQVTNFDYIKQGRVFVLNTGYEGFSHQLLEVLALGVPVVTTNVGGNPEIIKNGENGLLVTYNDKRSLGEAIERMFRDDDFRERCVVSGMETVNKFSKERMLNELVETLS